MSLSGYNFFNVIAKIFNPDSGAGKGYLSLTLRPEAIEHKWIERRPYYMDFRNSRFVAETDQEVVMSLNRVEHVFGKVQGA